jgi:hypothetical protein
MLSFRNSARLALAAAAALTIATTAQALEVKFGSEGPRVTLIFGKDKAGPKALTVFSQGAGGPGSTVSVTVDKGGVPLFSHQLTADDCTAGDKGNRCKFTVAGGTPEFDHLIESFQKGRNAKIRVSDEGGAALKAKASLKGFTKDYAALDAK